MNILHCICDDKFIKGAMELFNSDKRLNNVFVFVSQKNRLFKAKYLSEKDIVLCDESQFIKSLANYDVVVLHNWFSLREQIICEIPQKCKVVWLAWGFDLYNPRNPMIPINLYCKDTCKHEMSKNTRPAILFKLLDKYRSRYREKALSRIDYFSGVYPYEFDLLKKYQQNFNAKPLDFYYGSTNFFIKDDISDTVDDSKKDVIIGNSADPTNNHYEALTVLSKVSYIKDCNIIIPLSYGGDNEYKEWVKSYATTLFGSRCKPIDAYLPLQEYLMLVSNCKYALYAHRRQQASDNILMQIMYGANVFLSEESLALKHYKDLGLKVFSIESDLNEGFSGLNKEDIIHNREILAKYYGQSSLIKRVLLIHDIISQDIFESKEQDTNYEYF